MFYELIFQSTLLGHVADTLVFHQEDCGRRSGASSKEVRWFEPREDSRGCYIIRPIRFWAWLRTRKIRTQLDGKVEVEYQPQTKPGTLARWRVAILGLNTAFLKPTFPGLFHANIEGVREECRPLPTLRLHEQTRCGVHRTFELQRYERCSLPSLRLESIDELCPKDNLSHRESRLRFKSLRVARS